MNTTLTVKEEEESDFLDFTTRFRISKFELSSLDKNAVIDYVMSSFANNLKVLLDKGYRDPIKLTIDNHYPVYHSLINQTYKISDFVDTQKPDRHEIVNPIMELEIE